MDGPSDYESVIGLEVHVQLKTRTKLFCGCSARFGDPPNTNVCPVCLGYPGALPVLNRHAVDLALRMALAVESTVHEQSLFVRKNYFYPDLPKGYQITQYDRPLAAHGKLPIECEGVSRAVGISRIHLEEDAGKLLHEVSEEARQESGVDFNRSGVPLIEIVSEPDLRSGREAAVYAQTLKLILEYTGVSAANMEQGNLRCDGNVSVRRRGVSRLGNKVELKNLNSFRFLARALDYERERQVKVLQRGEVVVGETRYFDPTTGRTETLRSKEQEPDYRYFPEPDLPPLLVNRDWMERVRSTLPELPAAKKSRLIARYGIPGDDASVLTSSRPLADFFEATAAHAGNPRATSNWILSELLAKVNETAVGVEAFPISPMALGELLRLMDEGTIGGRTAKEVFGKMLRSGEMPSAIVAREGLVQITDRSKLAELARQVMLSCPKQVHEYRKGKTQILDWLVGRLMEATRGKANPQIARQLLRARLNGEDPDFRFRNEPE